MSNAMTRGVGHSALSSGGDIRLVQNVQTGVMVLESAGPRFGTNLPDRNGSMHGFYAITNIVSNMIGIRKFLIKLNAR